MSDSDDAYAEAQRLIAEAKASGTTILDLGAPKTRALNTLPPELSTLTALTSLNLTRTQVTDLAPLTQLTALTSLTLTGTQVTDLTPLTQLAALTWLDLRGTQVIDLAPLTPLTTLTTLLLSDTQVTDLAPLTPLTALTRLNLSRTQATDPRPLVALSKLATSPGYGGLDFHATPFAALPEFAGIAGIENNAERAQRLFAALEGWMPAGEVAAPEADPLLPTVLISGQLELMADPPSEAEREERLKRLLHSQLQEKAPALERQAGNVYPRLASKSRVVADLIAKPFEELDLVSIHLEIEDLTARANRGVEDGVPYTEDVANALDDVINRGPGLTLGHAEVDMLVARVNTARQNPTASDPSRAHAALSDQIIKDPNANGPRSREMESRLQSLEDPATQQVAVEAKHFGIVRLLGQIASAYGPPIVKGATGAFAGGVALQLFGVPVSNFLRTAGSILIDVALTYGPATAGWFGAVMGPIFLALGIEAAVVKRLNRK